MDSFYDALARLDKRQAQREADRQAQRKLNLRQPLGKLLVRAGACLAARQWAKAAGVKTAADAWQQCPSAQWMLWALSKTGLEDSPDSKRKLRRKLRRFASWCAKQVQATPYPGTFSAFAAACGTAASAAMMFADDTHDVCSIDSWRRCHAAACASQAQELRRIFGNPFEARQ